MVELSDTTPSPDVFGELEMLIAGKVTGAKITKPIGPSALSMFKIRVQAVVKFGLDRGAKNEHSRSYANFL